MTKDGGVRDVAGSAVELTYDAESLSHELRSALTSIQGHLELVLDGDLGQVDQAAREVLTRVHRSSGQLGAIVERFEAAHVVPPSLRPAPRCDAVVIDEVIDEVVTRIGRVGSSCSIELEVEESAQRLHVIGDRRQLTAILFHLVHGAIGSGSRRQHVTLSVRRAADEVVITVNDEASSRRWPSILARSDAEPDLPGGLGLVVVRSVLAAHGGTLSVAPARGGRVRVTISLPVAAPGPH